MSKTTKIILIVVGCLILLSGGGLGVYFYMKGKNVAEPEVVNKTNTLETIEGYGYTLEDRDSALFNRIFNELREVLSSENVDFKEYAKALSKLYVIDLYTIDNKINQYDVGSLEFVSPDAKENFELKVKDTIYKYVEDNSYGSRNQELPKVDSIEVGEVLEEEVETPNGKVPGYSVSLSWVYTKDLGYDKKCVLKLIRDDKMLYVVKQEVSE